MTVSEVESNLVKLIDYIAELVYTDGITTIKEYQNSPRPATPYISVHCDGLQKDNFPEKQMSPSVAGTETIRAHYNVDATVTTYGDISGAIASALSDGFQQERVNTYMESLGFTYRDDTEVFRVPELLDDIWENRWQFVIRLGFARVQTEDVSYIETVETPEGTINN